MKICGIISEFNPFHNGHEYIIGEAKRLTDSCVICLQSGNFVQRGEPAIAEKYERAVAAIKAGADAVIELPTVFATSPAEDFAMGAVKIFSAIGANYLAFGVENTSLEVLEQVANLKLENSDRFRAAFKDEMKNGINYNTALKRAIAKSLGENILEVLNKPNNVLAIEYLCAIKRLGANILPIVIRRNDHGYNSAISSGKFLSASAVRERILNGESYENFIPKNAKYTSFFMKNHIKTLETIELLNLRQLNEEALGNYFNYSEGIEFRVKKLSINAKNLEELRACVVTPRYREARVKRLLLYPTLKITKEIMHLAKTTVPACKILCIKKEFKPFLSSFDKKKISLIATNKDYESLSPDQKKIVEIDLAASTLYNTILETNKSDKKTGTLFL